MAASIARPAQSLTALLASDKIVTRRAPSTASWESQWLEPPDMQQFYAETDGLVLADGTTILRHADLARTTEWLKEERALGWEPDLLVIGERDDVVIVRDLDIHGVRAGGGVLEAPTDGLESFQRAAYGLMEYLLLRAGFEFDGEIAPEPAAREAVRQRDGDALARVIERPFYPGSERELAHAALVLGTIRAGSSDAPGALAAFERSVEARVHGARRGAEATERAEAWQACARAAGQAGAAELAVACRRRIAGAG